MYDYYFRCLETDYSLLTKLCVEAGIIEVVEKGEIVPVKGGVWDYIGKAYDKTTGREELKEGTLTKVDQTYLSKNSVPYIHVNVRTHVDLTEKLQKEVPDLAKFFYTDAEGKIVHPEEMMRVFL